MNRASRISIILAGLFLSVSPVLAQTYPVKPITFIVQYAAGSGADQLARFTSDAIQKEGGATFVVKNMPGALGTLGTNVLVRSAADGYTIGICSSSINSIASSIFKNLRYDPVKDFTFIEPMAVYTYVISSAPALGYKNLDDLVRDAKANPDKLSYAYPNATAQVLSASVRKQLGVQALPVPYKESVAGLIDLSENRISYAVTDMGVTVPMARAGRIKPLAVISPKRSAHLPDVPTFAELGKPAIEVIPWAGICGPRGMPPEAVNWLRLQIKKALGRPEIHEKFALLGLDPLDIGSVSFPDFAANQLPVWTDAAREAGITAEY